MTLGKILRYLLPIIILLVLVGLLRAPSPSRRETVGDGLPEILSLKVGHDGNIEGKTIRIIFGLMGYKSPTMTFSAGFQYELLREFCSDKKAVPIIRPSSPSGAFSFTIPDSTYIVAVPSGTAVPEGFSATKASPDGVVWATREEDFLLLEQIQAWMTEFESTSKYGTLRQRFTPNYGPYARSISGGSYSAASPYDALLKKYAPAIGWDWRALAALVWRESGFHIELVSHAGAQGLMQMMPQTFRHYSSSDDTLDPENNLRAATKYIAALEKEMRPYTATDDDLRRFTLACYNLGDGGFLDILNFAKRKGMPCSTWTDIMAVLPHLSKEALEKNPDPDLRFGPVNGDALIDYVNEMESLFLAFKLIASA